MITKAASIDPNVNSSSELLNTIAKLTVQLAKLSNRLEAQNDTSNYS
jgi:hypothetical protein